MSSEVERGPMEERDNHVIKNHFPYLMKTLDATHLTDHMFAKSVFDRDDLDAIYKVDGREKKMDKFLEILCWRGYHAYPKFIDVLKTERYHEAWKNLTDTHKDPNLIVTKKQRGPMKPADKNNILKHHAKLISDLNANDLLMYMYRYGVFDNDDINEIKQEIKKSRQEGMIKFMDILYNSGEESFPKFVDALRDSGYNEARKLLLK